MDKKENKMDNKTNNVAYVGNGPSQQGVTITSSTGLNPNISLYQKLFKAMSEIETIKKSGFNKHQGYQYSTEADLIEATKEAIVNNRILVLTSTETKDVMKLNKADKNGGTKETLLTIVNTKHTFVDIDTGASFEVSSTGTGWDDTDKGVFKAITGAMKYFMSKNFLVASEDDPEADGANPSYVRTSTSSGTSTAPAPTGLPARNKQTSAAPAQRKTFGRSTPTTTSTAATSSKPASTPSATRQETTTELSGKPSFSKRVAANEEPDFQYEKEEDI